MKRELQPVLKQTNQPRQLRHGSFRSGIVAGFAFVVGLTVSIPVFADNFLEDLKIGSETMKIIDLTEEPTTLAGSFLAAQSAATNGDDPQAIENFKRVLEYDPDNVRLKQSLMMALVANGDVEEATDLIGAMPPDEQSQNLVQVIEAANAMKQRSWSQAIARIDRITGTDLDNMVSAVFAGWALYGDRKPDEALARIDALVGPDWIEMIKEYHAGLILSANGRDQEAIARFDRALGFRAVAGALTETYMRAIEAKARAQARIGEIDAARQTVAEGFDLLRNHPPLVALEAELEKETPNLQPLVMTAAAGGAEVFFNMGTAISRQGGLPFAQGHLQLAHYLDPKGAAILLALGDNYEDQDRFEAANRYYQMVDAASPYHKRAQLEVALNLNRMDQVPAAIETLEALVQEDPDDLVTVLSLGGVHAQHDQFSEAIEVYSAAIERVSAREFEHWPLFYRRGIAYERTRQWPLAEADFKAALELSPDEPDVLNYLGYSWIDQGVNLEEGLDMIRKAVALRPNSGYIVDSLGWAYYRLGRYAEAVGELERALELLPTDPVINDHLGDAYWKVGRRLEATFQWRHALANNPEDKDRVLIQRKLAKGLTH